MFKNPFSFRGRIRRLEYGLSHIIAVIVLYLVTFLTASMGESAMTLLFFFYIPYIWFLLAQNTKRCHDIGDSGWWQLLPLYGFWLLIQDGQPGPNQYGENPKGIRIIGGQSYQRSGSDQINNDNNISSIPQPPPFKKELTQEQNSYETELDNLESSEDPFGFETEDYASTEELTYEEKQQILEDRIQNTLNSSEQYQSLTRLFNKNLITAEDYISRVADLKNEIKRNL